MSLHAPQRVPLRAPRGLARLALALSLSCAASVGCGGDDKGGRDSADTSTGDSSVAAEAPTITITAPVGGSTFAVGEAVELVATVAQVGGDVSKIEVTWTSDKLPTPLAVVRADGAGRAASSAILAAGVHLVTATAKDPSGQSGTASVSIVVDAPPSAPVVHIEPASPVTADELMAVLDQAPVDPSGDAVTVSYRWFVDGSEAGLQTAKVPAARTARGETWKVVVQAQDAAGNTVSATSEVVIGNTAPTCAAALVLPTAGDTEDRFTCRCSDRDDADGDEAADTCEFLVDGVAIVREGSGCELEPEHTERGMNLVCRLTPRDDEAAGEAIDSPPVSVLNAAPSAPTVRLVPVDPAVVDASGELRCEVLTAGVDADGDPVSHLVSWTVGGAPATLASAPETPASAATLRAGSLYASGRAARRGDAIACVVRASDGSDTSAAATSEAIVLVNAPPQLGNVLVTGSDAALTEGTTLSCTTASASDADQDVLTYAYAWYVDDQQVATSATLDGASFGKGDVVRCELTVNDGVASSAAVSSKNQVTIKNSPPRVGEVSLTPGSGTRGDTFTCTASGASDADGDPVTLRYAWKAVSGGQTLPVDGAGATLLASEVPSGATLACVVTPFDGEVEGAAVESNGASIQNTAPSLEGATLTPQDAVVGSTLTCAPVGFSDGDGDAPVYTYGWTRNAQSLTETGASLSGGFVEGDRIRCRVTPGDGLTTGATVTSNEVVIGNSAPSLAGVTLSPSAGSLCATYRCTAGETSDPDVADTVSVSYRWERNGAATGQTGATYAGTLAAGDTLRCHGTPSDGDASGPERSSALATVDNAPPTVASVAVTPATPGVGALLTCAPSGYADDCSTPSFDFRWFVDGAAVGTGATYDTDDEALGAKVRCEATPKDGLVSGTAVSSPEVTLGPGEAVAPVVAVQIDGASATCAIVEPERWFTNPSYTYYWTVNGGAEAVGAATRAASSCDLLSCRVVVADARATVSSEVATAQVALGDGCEDGNDCTSHVCAAGGGCGATLPTTGGACRPDDACQPLGVCNAGECVAEGNVCVEEIASVGAAGGRPYVAGLVAGGYVAQWVSGVASALRVTDLEDSRLSEELRIPADTTGYTASRASPPVALPDGGFLALSLGGRESFYDSGYGGTQSAWIDATLHRFDANGALVATNKVMRFAQACSPECGLRCSGGSYVCLSCSASISDYSGFPLSIDGVEAVVVAHRTTMSKGNLCGPGTNQTYGKPVVLVPGSGDQQGKELTLVATADLSPNRYVYAAGVPSGSEAFVVAWVGPTTDRLQLQRFTFRLDTLTSSPAKTVIQGTGDVSAPVITSFVDGSFVVGWTVASASNGKESWVQRFDVDGLPQGDAVRVNDVASGDQVLGGLAAFEDFGFAATYAEGTNHRLRLFSSSGTPQGASLGANASATGGQPSVARLVDDELVVSWLFGGAVLTRRLDRDGLPVAGVREVPIPDTTTGDQSRPRGAVGPNGRVLVAWDGPLFVGQDTEILARIVEADGLPRTSELQVNTTTAETQRGAVVAGSSDRWVIAWESLNEDGSGYGIYARILGPDGSPLTGAFRVNDTTSGLQQRPSVAMRADGTFLVSWDSGTTPVVFVKAFDKGGVALGGEVAVSTGASRCERPSVAVEPVSGVFFVAWQSKDQVAAGSGFDIFGRKVEVKANGSHVLGVEVRLNAASDLDQTKPALAVNGSNTLAACWETVDAASSTDLSCGTFRWSNLSVLTPEFALTPHQTGAQLEVSLAAAADGEVLATWTTEGVDSEGRAVQLRSLGVAGPAVGVRTMGNRWVKGHQQRPFVIGVTGERALLGWQTDGQDGSGAGVVTRLVRRP